MYRRGFLSSSPNARANERALFEDTSSENISRRDKRLRKSHWTKLII